MSETTPSPDLQNEAYLQHSLLDSEGAEVVPYMYSTDSTVSMETEESHDGHMITNSPLPIPTKSIYQVSFEFLDEKDELQEEDKEFDFQSPLNFKTYNGINKEEDLEDQVSYLPIKSSGLLLGNESNESTAEELDTVPCESGTTDTGNPTEGLFNEHGQVTYTHLQEDVIVTSSCLGHRPYENWSVVLDFNKEEEELGKRRKMISRSKGSRVGMRQRAPQPLPRPSHIKLKTTRPPAPIPHKRRPSGRTRPSLGNATSEGDMAQADEMGDEGEGDDGFIDGDMGGSKRRIKKRLSSVHVLMPSLPTISPPSSPSNTPISRRRLSSRKNRGKPRIKKVSKPTLASADISTQETTTPGPLSSDSDNSEVEEVESVSISNQEKTSGDENMSFKGSTVVKKQVVKSHIHSTNGLGPRKPDESTKTSIIKGNGRSVIKTKSILNDEGSNNDSQTSDNDLVSTSGLSLSSSHGKRGKMESDEVSTAPLSSETSDMSGNEKGTRVRRTSPSSGIPRLSKNSPVSSRKNSSNGLSTTQSCITLRGTKPHTAGSFVSRRTSVAAMINQFDSSQSSPEVSLKNSPTSKTPNEKPTSAGNGKTTLKRPVIPSKPVISKPELRPKPSVGPSTVTSSARKETRDTVTKPTPKTQPTLKKVESTTVKKTETLKKAVVNNKSSSNTDNIRSRVSPPLPPKPKSPSPSKPQPPVFRSDTSSESTSSSSSPSSAPQKTSEGEERKKDVSVKPNGEKKLVIKTTSNSGQTSKTSLTQSEEMKKDVSVKLTQRKKLVTKTTSNSGQTSKTGLTQTEEIKKDVSVKPTQEKKPVFKTTSNSGQTSKTGLTRSERDVSVKLTQEKKPVIQNGGQTSKTGSTQSVPLRKLPTTQQKISPPSNNTKLLPNKVKPTVTPMAKVISKNPETVKPIDETDNVSKDLEISSEKDSEQSKPVSTAIEKPTSTEYSVPTERVQKMSDKGTVNNKVVPDRIVLVDLTKSVQSSRTSTRRPPPDPPMSPPGEKNKSLNRNRNSVKKGPYPRVRSPPPLPPTSENEQGNKKPQSKPENIHSPRNYEEFVPALLRSESFTESTSPSVPYPMLRETKTKGENSTYEGITIKPYEDIILPIDRSQFVKSFSSSNTTEDMPPPLPPRNYMMEEPVIALPTSLAPVDEHSIPPDSTLGRKKSRDNIPVKSHSVDTPTPRSVSQLSSKKKSLLNYLTSNGSPLLKRKEIPPSLMDIPPPPPPSSPPVRKKENVYEEIPADPKWNSRNKVPFNNDEQHYEMSDKFLLRQSPKPRLSSPGLNDSIDSSTRRFSASVCVSNSSGLSPVTIRRANSDRLQHHHIPVVLAPLDNLNRQTSLQRTPSMDFLDDRMNQTVRACLTDPGYSSGEEDNSGAVSPRAGLPQPPKNTFSPPLQKKDSSSNKHDSDEEPLYQYLNHADFTTTPHMIRSNKVVTLPCKKESNQLEIARQLSINYRKLWCEQPEVISSGILQAISDQQRKLQEAMFEVITSEASYHRSLRVLIEHFMDDPGMNPNLPQGRRVLDKRQFHVIFSNVKEVREISARFLQSLKEQQKKSAIIDDICDLVLEYAENDFSCYIPYCTNQVYQMREMTELLEKNVMFIDYVKRLEAHKRCQNLSLTSFLLLPMQRITRMPLLILAILNRIPCDHPKHSIVEQSLRRIQTLVTACNEGAKQLERTEELHRIHKQLDFGKIKPFPIVSTSRYLERKGSLVLLEVEQRLFGKPRIRKTPVYVFAFTDYILITKRKKVPKGEVSYKIIDYASKAVVEIESLKVQQRLTYPKHTFGEQETLARATWTVSIAEEPNSFLLIFLANSQQKMEKYVIAAQNDTDCTRWREALTHPAKEKQKEDEKIYETWDCPQVQAIYDYTAEQPDELSLTRGDIVKVYRKMADGWFEGEKLRDLQWGWFPSNFTTEVENSHTRARNLKERHRLLSIPYNAQEFSQQFSGSLR